MKTWTVYVFILSMLGQLFATHSFITEDFLGGIGAAIMSFILTLSLLLLYVDSIQQAKMTQSKADRIFDEWPELDSFFQHQTVGALFDITKRLFYTQTDDWTRIRLHLRIKQSFSGFGNMNDHEPILFRPRLLVFTGYPDDTCRVHFRSPFE